MIGGPAYVKRIEKLETSFSRRRRSIHIALQVDGRSSNGVAERQLVILFFHAFFRMGIVSGILEYPQSLSAQELCRCQSSVQVDLHALYAHRDRALHDCEP